MAAKRKATTKRKGGTHLTGPAAALTGRAAPPSPSRWARGISPEPAATAEMAGETFLDRIAVAKRLGMKPRTVADWAKQGKLPAYRLGRYLRFRWAEVEERLAATCRVQGRRDA